MKKDNAMYTYIKDEKLDIDKVIDDFSGYLYTIIKNAGNFPKEDIEEMISDTYFILWKNQNKLDIEKKLSPYLFGIVKNLIKQRYHIFYNNNENIEDYEEYLIINENLDMTVQNNETNQKIINLLNKMKSKEKNIFYDFYFYSTKIKDIAVKYNLSESTVKSKLYRTRNRIRKELLKGGYSLNG